MGSVGRPRWSSNREDGPGSSTGHAGLAKAGEGRGGSATSGPAAPHRHTAPSAVPESVFPSGAEVAVLERAQGDTCTVDITVWWPGRLAELEWVCGLGNGIASMLTSECV